MTASESRQYCLADRFAGAILGTAFGDALGASVEGWSSAEIEAEYGEVRDYIEARMGAGCYTDDTQMMLATARSLARLGVVDGADCARSCAVFFDVDRGYGRSAIEIMQALAAGADYTETGNMLFPEGSFGNGAAMRIAPVGLLYGHLEFSVLRRSVYEAVRATHTHAEAVDGALVLAAAIGRLSRLEETLALDGSHLLRQLAPCCQTLEMRSRLMLAARMLESDVPIADVVNNLGNGVRSVDSVPTALYTALKYSHDPELAVVSAIGYGGDADTIAAMTGAVVGALNGASSFPGRWHDGLERGEDGYEALSQVACELSELVL